MNWQARSESLNSLIILLRPERSSTIRSIRTQNWIPGIQLRLRYTLLSRKIITSNANRRGVLVTIGRNASLSSVSFLSIVQSAAAYLNRNCHTVIIFRIECSSAIRAVDTQDWVPSIQLCWRDTLCRCEIITPGTAGGLGEFAAVLWDTGLL
ncbi:hypothetical protein VTO58DRAFT_102675 [Aureobasidium pullulans]